jgi:hypothetical protein
MAKPIEGDTRKCQHGECKGFQTYSELSPAPGSRAGTGDDKGNIIMENKRQPGWACNREPSHWDSV